MLAKKIAFNTIVSTVVRVLGTFLALVAIGLVTRYLDRAGWGEYSVVSAFGGIFAVLADLGLYQIMVKEISREGADESKIINNVFSFRLAGSFFIFALAPLVSFLLPYSSQLRLGILVGMTGFWLLNSAQVLMGVFQKYLQIDKVAIAELASKIVQLGLVYLFIRLNLGFLWIVATISFGALANLLLILYFLRKFSNLKLEFDFPFWVDIWKKSFPLAISNILITIYFSANAIIISIFHPPSDVGIFRLSYKVLESLIFFPAMFAGLVMPLLSKFSHKDWPAFKKIFQRSSDVLLISGIPLVFGGISLSPQIIRLLGGGNFPESVGVLAVLMVAVGFIFLGTLFSFVLIAIDKSKLLLFISAAGVIFNLILNFWLIPDYSYTAAAIISVLTEGLVTLLMAVVIFRILRFLPSFKTGFKSLMAALIMAALIWWFRNLNVLVLLLGGAAAYSAALYLFKGISVGEIREIFRERQS